MVERFYNLQVLRTLTAIVVLLVHMGMYAKLAFGHDTPFFQSLLTPIFGWSVCLFFSISGFVVAHSLKTTPSGRFLIQRLIRVFPTYWIAVVFGLIIRSWLDFSPVSINKYFCYGLTLLPGGREHAYVLFIEWTLVFEVTCYFVVCAFAHFGGYRAVIIGSLVWLAACLARIAVWPEGAMTPMPGWQKIAISAHNVPFLLGVLACALKDHGRPLRPFVFPAVAASFFAAPLGFVSVPWAYVIYSVGSAGVIWLAVTGRDADKASLLVRWGDWTYGLYLLHPMFLLAVFMPLAKRGQPLTEPLIFFAGAVALFFGSAFGALEFRFSQWLRRKLLSRKKKVEQVSNEPPELRLAA
jgi:peptidoglycan/LPS O-acetylase OafA/YrhL